MRLGLGLLGHIKPANLIGMKNFTEHNLIRQFIPAKLRARIEVIPRRGDKRLRQLLAAALERAVLRADTDSAIRYVKLRIVLIRRRSR